MTDYLETNGARIAYDVAGSGEPVLLVHAGVADRSMWDDQVEALRDAYRVIRHDTRGFGETETEAVPFSNRADIAALLDHLGERSAHLVGLSRGGQIVLDFALEFPGTRALPDRRGRGCRRLRVAGRAAGGDLGSGRGHGGGTGLGGAQRLGDRLLGRWTGPIARPGARGPAAGPRVGADELPGGEGRGRAAAARPAR